MNVEMSVVSWQKLKHSLFFVDWPSTRRQTICRCAESCWMNLVSATWLVTCFIFSVRHQVLYLGTFFIEGWFRVHGVPQSPGFLDNSCPSCWSHFETCSAGVNEPENLCSTHPMTNKAVTATLTWRKIGRAVKSVALITYIACYMPSMYCWTTVGVHIDVQCVSLTAIGAIGLILILLLK